MTRNVKSITAFLAALLLLMLIFGNTKISSGLRSVSFWALRPFLVLSHKTGMDRGADASLKEVGLRAEIERLRKDNEALRKIFSFRQESNISLRGARVLLYSRESGREFLLTDAGKKDGVTKGELVVDDNKIFVGTVGEVAENYSKVITASSPGESFEVEILPLKVRALAKGMGAGALRLDLIPADTPIRKGDFIFLSSSGGGQQFAVGEIAENKSKNNTFIISAIARHLTRPESLGQVFIASMRP